MRKSPFVALALAALVAAPALAQNVYVIEANGNLPADLADLVSAAGGTLHSTFPAIDLAVALSDDADFGVNLEANQGIQHCTQDVEIQWLPVPESFDLEVLESPSSEGHGGNPAGASFFPCQWNLRQIDAPGAWAQDQFGDPDVKVAVLDTGVDPFHSDLVGRVDTANSISALVAPSICDLFAPDVGTFFDFNFHGTFVSGIITSNGLGVAGVAPLATVVGVKVLNCLGSGTFADVISGIMYAASLPDVDVINMSLGAYFPKEAGGGPLVAALNKAVNFAASQGVLVVSSSGNQGIDLDHDSNFIHVPSQAGSSASCWAGDIDGNLAGYSNHGLSGADFGAGGGDNTPGSPQLPLPGCALPVSAQDGIMSACSTFSLFFGCGPASYLIGGSGTSFAAPACSGVAALVDGKYGGAKNHGQLEAILQETADDLGKPGADNLFSHGRVNAGKAVQ